MTPGFTARGRAEEFHTLVEGGSDDRDTRRYAEALEVVGLLRESAPVEPRPEFVRDLRSQLMAEAATVLTPTAAKLTVRPRRSGRERRLAVAIGGFAVVSATTSMAVASQSALPGDTLYPLKRAIESASTQVQLDEDARAASMLAHATDRLAEVDRLSRADGDVDGGAVAETLHDFADQSTQASDLLLESYAESDERRHIDDLQGFVDDSRSSLEELQPVVPETARPALIEATTVVDGIEALAFEACPTCAPTVTEPLAASGPANDLAQQLQESLGGDRGGDRAPTGRDSEGTGGPQAGPSAPATQEPPTQDPSDPTKPADGGSGTTGGPQEPAGPLDPILGNGGSGTGGNNAAGGGTGTGGDGQRPGTLGEVLTTTVNGLLGGLLGGGR